MRNNRTFVRECRYRAPVRLPVYLALVAAACTNGASGSGGAGGSGNGGASSAGGSGSGGVSGIGGSGSGGASSTGGSGSGGTASTGGSGNGGASGTGGSGSGGAFSTGGSGSGGVSGIGGSGNGGVSSTGGSGSGGASGTGGSGSGGMSSSGGSGGGGGSVSGGSGSGGATGSGGGTGTGGTGEIQSCPSLPGAPTGTQPLPSAAQLSYQRTEMTAFIHYGLATYDGSEQGNPSDSPSIFNPTTLDATSVGQWASSLKAAGFGQAMLVTKHSVGFTLWPSKYTDYSVKSSPWMNGNGDAVQLFTDAMHTSGMRPALYLSPWDQKYPSSKSDYITYFKNEITEILSYGPAYEIEFDGAQFWHFGDL